MLYGRDGPGSRQAHCAAVVINSGELDGVAPDDGAGEVESREGILEFPVDGVFPLKPTPPDRHEAEIAAVMGGELQSEAIFRQFGRCDLRHGASPSSSGIVTVANRARGGCLVCRRLLKARRCSLARRLPRS